MKNENADTGLSKSNLSNDPFDQFQLWFEEANEKEDKEANSMGLSTVSETGQPSSRTVLLKLYDKEGFVFFTNYESRKAKEIDGNSKVSLLFYWPVLQRQVRIEGEASKIPASESLKYFLTRPRGSQIGAWSSNQSCKISSRQLLLTKFQEFTKKFKDRNMELPSFWGGYRVVPHRFEFWQGRENRLHDRFRFDRKEAGGWEISRLAP